MDNTGQTDTKSSTRDNGIASKSISFIRTLCAALKLRNQVPTEVRIAQFLASGTRAPCRSSQTDILVQCPEDPYYYALFGLITHSLRKRRNLVVDRLHFHSVRHGESVSIFAYVVKRLEHMVLQGKWSRLYGVFTDRLGYRCSATEFSLASSADKRLARKLLNGISNKDELCRLVINGHLVGDLINDTYIRFRPFYTVDLKDPFLYNIIRQAIKDIRLAENYYDLRRPKILLTSYSTYIQHGIPVRVALSRGISVYSFGHRQRFCKRITTDDLMSSNNPDHYAVNFNLLVNQSEAMEKAEGILRARLAGATDRATSYMRRSAYSCSDATIPDVRDAVIVFLHCFYDSPHTYRNTVFSDFWEWARFTIRELEKCGVKYFVKQHPNWIRDSEKAFAQLRLEFPNMPILSDQVSNKRLVEAGISCAVSVHGTVTHEMAYLGIPTISCGDNPHVAFGFCKTTNSKTEFAEALKNHRNLPRNAAKLKRDSLAFFYMHNLNIKPDEARALEDMAKMSKLFNEDEDIPIAVIEKILGDLSRNEVFGSFIEQVIGQLDKECLGIPSPKSSC